MRVSPLQKARIQKELKSAGFTRYGLLKMESRYLPSILHKDEHIGGAIYGRHENGSGMLIATDKRVIFLDRKPLFTVADELTYYVVSGVSIGTQSLFSAVTLHTRLGDYKLHYVNPKCATRFVHYIEQRRIEEDEQVPHIAPKQNENEPAINPETPPRSKLVDVLTPEALLFLHSHDTATFSSIDREGNVHGAVMHYFTTGDNHIYLLTKSGTQKAHNVFSHHQVALTVYDADTLQTINIQGNAEVEARRDVKDFIVGKLRAPRTYGGKLRLPPVTDLSEGSFTVLRITPFAAKYADYRTPRK